MDTATWQPVATKEESGDVDLSESETGSDEDVTWKPVAFLTATGNPMHPVNQTAREVQKLKKTEWLHNLHVSPATIVRKGLSHHQRQNQLLLRLCALCGKNGR